MKIYISYFLLVFTSFLNFTMSEVIFECKISQTICHASPKKKIIEENLEISFDNKVWENNYRRSVTEIKFFDCVINFLPNGFDKYFKKIKSLTIHSTGLKKIEKENLKQFPELEKLTISYNNLAFIKSDLFEFNPKINIVDLRYNKIFYVSEKLIEDFKHKTLNVSHNDLKGLEYYAKIVSHFDEEIKKFASQNKFEGTEQKLKELGKIIEVNEKSINSQSVNIKQNTKEIKEIKTSLRHCVNKSEISKQNENIRQIKLKNNDLETKIKNLKDRHENDNKFNTNKINKHENEILSMNNDIRMLKNKAQDDETKLNKKLDNFKAKLPNEIETVLRNNRFLEEKASKKDFLLINEKIEKFMKQLYEKDLNRGDTLMSNIAISSLIITNVILILIVVTLSCKINAKANQEREKTKQPAQTPENATIQQESLYNDPNYDEIPTTSTSILESKHEENLYDTVFERKPSKLQNDEFPVYVAVNMSMKKYKREK